MQTVIPYGTPPKRWKNQIGELVMKYLEQTDQIAYVRFASVYRQFADVRNFMQELERIMQKSKDAK